MLHIIRNNSPYTVIILFIFALIAKLQVLSNPALPVVAPDHELFNAVIHILKPVFGSSAFGYTMLAVLMLFGQAIYLNSVAVRHKLLLKSNYIVAFMYIGLTSIFPAFNYLSEILLVNWCLIAGVDFMLSLHTTSHPRSHIYNLGFIMSTAALLHFQSVMFILPMFAAIGFLRPFNIGEWVVAIIGYLTPIYLYSGILFLFDKEKAMLHWAEIGWSLPGHLSAPAYLIGTLIGLITLAICGVYVLQPYLAKTSIYIRRMWTAIAIMLFSSIAASLTTAATENSTWLLAMLPLSLVISPALNAEKNKWFSNFAFYFSILLLVYCQLTIK